MERSSLVKKRSDCGCGMGQSSTPEKPDIDYGEPPIYGLAPAKGATPLEVGAVIRENYGVNVIEAIADGRVWVRSSTDAREALMGLSVVGDISGARGVPPRFRGQNVSEVLTQQSEQDATQAGIGTGALVLGGGGLLLAAMLMSL